jgi:hypothetical protein
MKGSQKEKLVQLMRSSLILVLICFFVTHVFVLSFSHISAVWLKNETLFQEIAQIKTKLQYLESDIHKLRFSSMRNSFSFVSQRFLWPSWSANIFGWHSWPYLAAFCLERTRIRNSSSFSPQQFERMGLHQCCWRTIQCNRKWCQWRHKRNSKSFKWLQFSSESVSFH